MWNYRVIESEGKQFEGIPSGPFYGIHECFYDDIGRVWGCSESSCEPYGETLDELREDFRYMGLAFDKPVINIKNIPEDGSVSPWIAS